MSLVLPSGESRPDNPLLLSVGLPLVMVLVTTGLVYYEMSGHPEVFPLVAVTGSLTALSVVRGLFRR